MAAAALTYGGAARGRGEDGGGGVLRGEIVRVLSRRRRPRRPR